MAYSELVKNFDRIRDFMRQFYVYGFRSRGEFDKKSGRSYDNERRRIESWLGHYMGFRRSAEGKQVFLSVDSRSIPADPLHCAFKAKSFTDLDVTLHFYILDLLRGGPMTAGELLDGMYREYLCQFDSPLQPDLSSLRRKLKEYTLLGLLRTEKRGREVVYARNDCHVDLDAWADTLSFFSEADPLGVIGSYLLDRLEEQSDRFRFKHHYLLHTLDSGVLLPLLEAIGQKRSVRIVNFSPRSRGKEMLHWVCPAHIWVSTQDGRQYLMCYHYGFRKMMCFRLDYIQSVQLWTDEPRWDQLTERCEQYKRHLWGTSGGAGRSIDHFEMIIRWRPGEEYIPQRLEREKRTGTLEDLGSGWIQFTADVYDASELMPWVRTFIGRIEKLECSNPAVTERFRETLREMYEMYGGGHDLQ